MIADERLDPVLKTDLDAIREKGVLTEEVLSVPDASKKISGLSFSRMDMFGASAGAATIGEGCVMPFGAPRPS